MISKPTVLIFGAGVSCDYKYPSGNKLIDDIYKLYGNVYFMKVSNQIGYSDELLHSFCSELVSSQLLSIDSFLEKRAEFIDIGKIAIAYCLSQYESDEMLYDSDLRLNGCYRYLYDKMGPCLLWNQLIDNDLSIITFNYDRSLEYFLYNAIKHTYRPTDENISNFFQNFRIIHVHGSLGPFLGEGDNVRPYKSINVVEAYEDSVIREKVIHQLVTSSKNIKIISEGHSSSDEFRLAKDILIKADRVIFLGFGYHQTNLKRLEIEKIDLRDDQLIDPSRTFRVYDRILRGSGYGLGQAERDTIERKFNIYIPDGGLNSLKFLKEYAPLDYEWSKNI